MFQRIHVSGLGPLDDVTFDLSALGQTEITGGSECGKSTLAEALIFALWGTAGDGRPFPTEAIREGSQRAAVEATTARGTVLRRSLTRSRAQSRELVVGEEVQVFTREEDLAARLGPAGQKPDLGRLVVSPFAWLPLLQRELGRPLRDLLLSALPSGDLRAEISRQMGEHKLRDGDPLDAAGAARLQTATNRSRDEARGRLDAARSRTASSAEPDAVDQAAVQAARDSIAAGEAWTAYDTALERYGSERRARATQAQALDDWRRRRAELGERPAADPFTLRAAQEKTRRLEAELATARRRHQEAILAQREASMDLETARGACRDLQAAGDACPTCERAGWADAARRLETAEAKVQRLVAVAAERAEAAEAAGQAPTSIEDQIARARGEVAAAERAEAAPRAWDDRLRAIGTEPQVPVPTTEPRKPSAARPAQDRLGESHRILRAAVEAEGARKRAAAEADRTRAELADATVAWERADREAQRVEVLVAACRRAPSEIARAQAEALGDLGPVRICFPEKENKATPEVEVLVDGRPVWLASTGRQVVADLWLRAAIRRISGLAALPIVVDRVQDWSGEWPAIPGPVWMLRTTHGQLRARVV